MIKIVLIVLSIVFLTLSKPTFLIFYQQMFGNTDNSVEVKSEGQLGNQLFEYWSGKIYAKKNNKLLILNDFNYLKSAFEIPEFAIADCPYTYALRSEEERESLQNKTQIIKQQVPPDKDSVFLMGYMQSYQNLKGYDDYIRKMTRFKEKPNIQNESIIAKMQNENSVSIHIRRGDYLTNQYVILSPDWYQKAINIIKRRVNNPFFYIFSDDIQWVQKNFKIDVPHLFVTWNRGEDSYNDMRLMTFCKHNIIANSSFSWWGAFLGNPKDKIVIMPDKWMPWEPDWQNELTVPGWIILPVE